MIRRVANDRMIELPRGKEQGEEIVSVLNHLCTIWLGIDVIKGFSCLFTIFVHLELEKQKKAQNKNEMFQMESDSSATHCFCSAHVCNVQRDSERIWFFSKKSIDIKNVCCIWLQVIFAESLTNRKRLKTKCLQYLLFLTCSYPAISIEII